MKCKVVWDAFRTRHHPLPWQCASAVIVAMISRTLSFFLRVGRLSSLKALLLLLRFEPWHITSWKLYFAIRPFLSLILTFLQRIKSPRVSKSKWQWCQRNPSWCGNLKWRSILWHAPSSRQWQTQRTGLSGLQNKWIEIITTDVLHRRRSQPASLCPTDLYHRI